MQVCRDNLQKHSTLENLERWKTVNAQVKQVLKAPKIKLLDNASCNALTAACKIKQKEKMET